MKKFILLIAFSAFIFSANAQYDIIKKGIKVGSGGTKTLIDSTELKALNGVTGNISTDYAKLSDGFVLTDSVYLKRQVDAFQYIFTIHVDGSSVTSPADATTYYMGMPVVSTATTGQGNRRVYMIKDCVLIGYACNILVGTGGTSETYSIYIRKNGSTDTSLGSTFESSTTASAKYFQASNLNVSFAAGDYFEIKIVTPTWATNPASINHSFILYFKTTKP